MHTSLYITPFIKNKLCPFEKNTFLENFEMEKNFDQRGFIKIAVRNERGTREIHQDLIVACGESAYCFSSVEKWDGMVILDVLAIAFATHHGLAD